MGVGGQGRQDGLGRLHGERLVLDAAGDAVGTDRVQGER
jgi:hypothetical protein